MSKRAKNSGVRLTEGDAAIIKGMLKRGDRQHDIAAWFGVNPGRIAEIKYQDSFKIVAAAAGNILPPVGPYPSGREAMLALEVISRMRSSLSDVEQLVSRRQ